MLGVFCGWPSPIYFGKPIFSHIGLPYPYLQFGSIQLNHVARSRLPIEERTSKHIKTGSTLWWVLIHYIGLFSETYYQIYQLVFCKLNWLRFGGVVFGDMNYEFFLPGDILTWTLNQSLGALEIIGGSTFSVNPRTEVRAPQMIFDILSP